MLFARPHLFEFIDQSWYPGSLRDLQTDGLQKFMGSSYEVVAPLIQQTLDRSGTTAIVDLASGGGGPWPGLRSRLGSPDERISITLTDWYPNLPKFDRLRRDTDEQLRHVKTPVDAMNVSRELVGMRTMFGGFHHFRPTDARAILADAAKAGTAIGIFDIGSARTDLKSLIQTLVFFGVAPLFNLIAYFIMTPMLGPLTLPRVVFTYFIPVVPLVTAWDGMVSGFRAYTQTELRDMTASLERDGYAWEVGVVKGKQFPINYVIGYPLA